jgi:ubiquinone/menaquinone biosynthesis C-methylase UbiE
MRAMHHHHHGQEYVPAAGRHWALPFYDLLAKAMGADRARQLLVDQAAGAAPGRFLDVGCGTGSLVLLLKRAHPGAEIIGLDPDPNALAIARRKASRAGLQVEMVEGFADALPYPNGGIDRLFSSLMYHHLRGEQKDAMLREVARVLAPGGRFHMLDFAGPGAADRRGFIARHLHGSGALRGNDTARVFERMSGAGLIDAKVVARLRLHAVDVCVYEASAPTR